MQAGRQEDGCCPSPAESVDCLNATSAASYRRVNARCTIPSGRSPAPARCPRRKVRLLRLPRRCLIGFAGGVPSCCASSIVGSVVGREALRFRCRRIGDGTNRGAGQLPSRLPAARFLAGFVDCRVGSRPRHRGRQASRWSGSKGGRCGRRAGQPACVGAGSTFFTFTTSQVFSWRIITVAYRSSLPAVTGTAITPPRLRINLSPLLIAIRLL